MLAGSPCSPRDSQESSPAPQFKSINSSVLRLLCDPRRSNQSILKEINPEYSLEGLMLKLKLQYFGRLMETANSLEKTPMLGKTEGRKRRGQQRMRYLHGVTIDGHELEQTVRDSDGHRNLVCCSPWSCRELDTTERLNNSNQRATHVSIRYFC